MVERVTTSSAPQSTPQLAPHEREVYLARREAILLELRTLERVLGLPPTRQPRDERQSERKERHL